MTRRLSFSLRIAVVLTVALAATGRPQAVQSQAAQAASRFDVTDVMIPARDGVRLHTRIFAPKGSTTPLPFIFQRTPYGVDSAEGKFLVSLKELADERYIFVFQDIRGRYKSEGTFVMQRPARDPNDTRAIDEGTDTYDTIDWLLKNVPLNNGRVGMLGVWYDGWTTAMATIEPHPALKAVSPQASPADMWLGDDFHHNGAFRLSYGFEYAAMMETTKESTNFAFDRYDTYQWYLALGPLANVNARYLHGKIPTWNDYVAHPDYDAFWKRQTLVPSLKDVKVPTLSVAGWWDQEDFYGPVRIYDALERFDRQKGLNYIVVGPWNHGGWNAPEGQKLGAIDFASATSKYFREQVQAPWFAYWLKDKGTLGQPEALTFEGGTNQWRRWSAWPPKQETASKNLYFQADGRLSFQSPAADAGGDAFDSYVSDPAHPVPYRHRPIQATYFPGGSGWYTWLLEDQRFVESRSDVLSWETEPLQADVTVAGRDRRQPVCLDLRQRQRLDRQADRRLSGDDAQRLEAGGVGVDGRQRGVPRPLPQRVRPAGGDGARPGDADFVQPPHAGLLLPHGAPHHGAAAEQLVPADRPEPANLRTQHLRGEGIGLSHGDAAHLPLGRPPVTREYSGGQMN